MALRIETFSNATGGSSLFKALGHPLAREPMARLIGRLRNRGPVAVYDPFGFAATLGELHDLTPLDVAEVCVQDASHIGQTILGRTARPIVDLKGRRAGAVLVAAFDAERLVGHMRHLVPNGAEVVTLDQIRVPEALLTNRRQYLDALNFATNLVFFRDTDRAEGGHRTRLTTANYWSGYGGKNVSFWLMLFDGDGRVLAEWTQPLGEGASGVTIDSRDIRRRFGLPAFAGQIFLHVVGAAGHDVVKYALDILGDDPAELSCTHDANAWPADFYAGLPAPGAGERVVLWLQNAHPSPVPAGSIGVNAMGSDRISTYARPIPGFGTVAVDIKELLPELKWPGQIEIRAGRHVVRPRYEIESESGRRRIAHANVERTDLRPDPKLPELGNLFGKGFILPAPILPLSRWRTMVQPTPMATSQLELPIAVVIQDSDGRQAARRRIGRLPRHRSIAVDVDDMLSEAGATLPGGVGHVEVVYDFADGGEADGWLHALFRYVDRHTGHAADTSFGAHVFNTVLTYKGEPQSYAGRPPGLSTRLFLRLGEPPLDTMCHLVYPASTPWHPASSTELVLTRGDGERIASRHLAIPCGGSRHWRYRETFAAEERQLAGPEAYVVIRDTTCRLFGYHGLIRDDVAFSLDHMFGF